MSDKPVIPEENEKTKRSYINPPFHYTNIRAIARQSLLYGGQPRGITKKAAYYLSVAAKLFVGDFVKEFQKTRTSQKAIVRKDIYQTVMNVPRFRFAMCCLRRSDIFQHVGPQNSLSHRVALHYCEEEINFPIPFVTPKAGNRQKIEDEAQKLREEAIDTDALIRSIAMAHSAYRQTIPRCITLKPRLQNRATTKPK